ncbi:putative vomeronasal receptor-like protein 4 [Perognathus longimembris pacificus]|uniref:putative vomeronasal receptor-like protein 4 n=1 Tax=Perognathus longimembris pacificus TaxID=214514 RepID=UPI0020185647|nr:putative vomeronasal receptor-like protein 4 [Perognathus longimembris pacificus]
MIWSNIIQKILFLFLSGQGIVGNIFVLVRHVYIFSMGPEKKTVDIVLIHLVFSNTLVICSIEIRQITTNLNYLNFLGDVGCKIVVYLERVARGLSICTTCLLSMIQAITISPRASLCRKIKPQTTWQVLPYLLLFWVLNSLISSNLLRYIIAVRSMNSSTRIEMPYQYCCMLPSKEIIKWLFLSLLTLRDVIFQSLMGWSSGHMAFHLYKHHKRVLYLHSSRFTHNSSPEIRATLSILILMTCFLVFYWADFMFSFYIGSTLKHDSTILNIKLFIELGYASLSPFVLINQNVHRVS